jgi:hypothetical protein
MILKNNNLSNKLLLIFIGILLLVLSGVIINGSISQFDQLEDEKKIQAAILAGDEKAIKSLENLNIHTASKIIQDQKVKLAIVKFYYGKIDDSIELDQFQNALSLLGSLKKIYPASDELLEKYQQIQTKKQQRLAVLTQQYIECLDQTLAPLLERTHCMAKARTEIENVGIEHSLPIDANLPAMYAEEIRHALTEKNYYQAETLLLDWQKLLPDASLQRNAQKAILILHRQLKSIIVDLTGNDKTKIVKRLSQLNTDPILQQEILAMPQIQNNLLAFHLNQALVLLSAKDNNIKIPANIKEELKAILNAEEEVVNDIFLSLPIPINKL